jgi:hypothetical protein
VDAGGEMKRFLVVLMTVVCANSPSSTQSQTKTTAMNHCPGEATFSAEPPFDKLIHENDPEKQIAQLDEFVAKHPMSDLLVYVYPLYCEAYGKLENSPMVMEYAEKTLALGSKATVNDRYVALHAWTAAYNSLNSDDVALAAKAITRSNEGIEVVSKMEIPQSQCVDANTFELKKQLATIYFHATAGAAAMKLKNYGAASGSLKAILRLQDEPFPSAPQHQ